MSPRQQRRGGPTELLMKQLAVIGSALLLLAYSCAT
jgi:hypothetical protein